MEYILLIIILLLTQQRQLPFIWPAAPVAQVVTPRAATPPVVTPSTPRPAVIRSLTVAQKRRAEQLTSVFENGTPRFDYAVIENLGDGRGYTAGRAGFTTATGDAYLVAERYTEQVPTNPLAPYLPRLKQLAADEDDDTSELVGFVHAWQQAARDARFVGVQDAVIDELYYRPAMAAADALGMTSALGRAILYDTIIQHGGGEDADSLSALIARTTQSLKGSPKTGVSETRWLTTFLAVRREDLLRPANRTTQEVWAVSVGRVDVLKKLLSDGNLDLNGPIQIESEDYNATIL